MPSTTIELEYTDLQKDACVRYMQEWNAKRPHNQKTLKQYLLKILQNNIKEMAEKGEELCKRDNPQSYQQWLSDNLGS